MPSPPAIVATDNLWHAAFLRALDASVVSIGDGATGHGEVVLDVSQVTGARARQLGQMLADQLAALPDAPSAVMVERVVRNTLLGRMTDEHSDLKNRILKRRSR